MGFAADSAVLHDHTLPAARIFAPTLMEAASASVQSGAEILIMPAGAYLTMAIKGDRAAHEAALDKLAAEAAKRGLQPGGLLYSFDLLSFLQLRDNLLYQSLYCLPVLRL